MYRNEFPRLYELSDLNEDPKSPEAFLNKLDKTLSEHEKRQYEALENELQGLDADAWEVIKNKAKHYLNKKTDRGWQQLFNVLQNEPRAYNYLKELGYTSIQFLPETNSPGPDLKGEKSASTVFCEVKTINISDDELVRRQLCAEQGHGEVATPMTNLSDEFFGKLKKTIGEAKRRQLETYDADLDGEHMVFVVVHFDEYLNDYKRELFEQIDQFFSENKYEGIRIVIYNQKTPAHMKIEMKHVEIVNEGYD